MDNIQEEAQALTKSVTEASPAAKPQGVVEPEQPAAPVPEQEEQPQAPQQYDAIARGFGEPVEHGDTGIELSEGPDSLQYAGGRGLREYKLSGGQAPENDSFFLKSKYEPVKPYRFAWAGMEGDVDSLNRKKAIAQLGMMYNKPIDPRLKWFGYDQIPDAPSEGFIHGTIRSAINSVPQTIIMTGAGIGTLASGITEIVGETVGDEDISNAALDLLNTVRDYTDALTEDTSIAYGMEGSNLGANKKGEILGSLLGTMAISLTGGTAARLALATSEGFGNMYQARIGLADRGINGWAGVGLAGAAGAGTFALGASSALVENQLHTLLKPAIGWTATMRNDPNTFFKLLAAKHGITALWDAVTEPAQDMLTAYIGNGELTEEDWDTAALTFVFGALTGAAITAWQVANGRITEQERIDKLTAMFGALEGKWGEIVKDSGGVYTKEMFEQMRQALSSGASIEDLVSLAKESMIANADRVFESLPDAEKEAMKKRLSEITPDGALTKIMQEADVYIDNILADSGLTAEQASMFRTIMRGVAINNLVYRGLAPSDWMPSARLGIRGEDVVSQEGVKEGVRTGYLETDGSEAPGTVHVSTSEKMGVSQGLGLTTAKTKVSEKDGVSLATRKEALGRLSKGKSSTVQSRRVGKIAHEMAHWIRKYSGLEQVSEFMKKMNEWANNVLPGIMEGKEGVAAEEAVANAFEFANSILEPLGLAGETRKYMDLFLAVSNANSFVKSYGAFLKVVADTVKQNKEMIESVLHDDPDTLRAVQEFAKTGKNETLSPDVLHAIYKALNSYVDTETANAIKTAVGSNNVNSFLDNYVAQYQQNRQADITNAKAADAKYIADAKAAKATKTQADSMVKAAAELKGVSDVQAEQIEQIRNQQIDAIAKSAPKEEKTDEEAPAKAEAKPAEETQENPVVVTSGEYKKSKFAEQREEGFKNLTPEQYEAFKQNIVNTIESAIIGKRVNAGLSLGQQLLESKDWKLEKTTSKNVSKNIAGAGQEISIAIPTSEATRELLSKFPKSKQRTVQLAIARSIELENARTMDSIEEDIDFLNEVKAEIEANSRGTVSAVDIDNTINALRTLYAYNQGDEYHDVIEDLRDELSIMSSARNEMSELSSVSKHTMDRMDRMISDIERYMEYKTDSMTEDDFESMFNAHLEDTEARGGDIFTEAEERSARYAGAVDPSDPFGRTDWNELTRTKVPVMLPRAQAVSDAAKIRDNLNKRISYLENSARYAENNAGKLDPRFFAEEIQNLRTEAQGYRADIIDAKNQLADVEQYIKDNTSFDVGTDEKRIPVFGGREYTLTIGRKYRSPIASLKNSVASFGFSGGTYSSSRIWDELSEYTKDIPNESVGLVSIEDGKPVITPLLRNDNTVNTDVLQSIRDRYQKAGWLGEGAVMNKNMVMTALLDEAEARFSEMRMTSNALSANQKIEVASYLAKLKQVVDTVFENHTKDIDDALTASPTIGSGVGINELNWWKRNNGPVNFNSWSGNVGTNQVSLLLDKGYIPVNSIATLARIDERRPGLKVGDRIAFVHKNGVRESTVIAHGVHEGQEYLVMRYNDKNGNPVELIWGMDNLRFMAVNNMPLLVGESMTREEWRDYAKQIADEEKDSVSAQYISDMLRLNGSFEEMRAVLETDEEVEAAGEAEEADMLESVEDDPLESIRGMTSGNIGDYIVNENGETLGSIMQQFKEGLAAKGVELPSDVFADVAEQIVTQSNVSERQQQMLRKQNEKMPTLRRFSERKLGNNARGMSRMQFLEDGVQQIESRKKGFATKALYWVTRSVGLGNQMRNLFGEKFARKLGLDVMSNDAQVYAENVKRNLQAGLSKEVFGGSLTELVKWNSKTNADLTDIKAKFKDGTERTISKQEIMSIYLAKTINDRYQELVAEHGRDEVERLGLGATDSRFNGGDELTWKKLNDTYANIDELLSKLDDTDKKAVDVMSTQIAAAYNGRQYIPVTNMNRTAAGSWGMRKENGRLVFGEELTSADTTIIAMPLYQSVMQLASRQGIKHNNFVGAISDIKMLLDLSSVFGGTDEQILNSEAVSKLSEYFNLGDNATEQQYSMDTLRKMISLSKRLRSGIEEMIGASNFDHFMEALKRDAAVEELEYRAKSGVAKVIDKMTRSVMASVLIGKPKSAAFNMTGNYAIMGGLSSHGMLRYQTTDFVNALMHCREAWDLAMKNPTLKRRFDQAGMSDQWERLADMQTESLFADVANFAEQHKFDKPAEFIRSFDAFSKKLTKYGIGATNALPDVFGLSLAYYNLHDDLVAMAKEEIKKSGISYSLKELDKVVETTAQDLFNNYMLTHVSNSNYMTRGLTQKKLAEVGLSSIVAFTTDQLLKASQIANASADLMNTTDPAERKRLWNEIKSAGVSMAWYVAIQAGIIGALIRVASGDDLDEEEVDFLKKSLARELAGQLTGAFQFGNLSQDLVDSIFFGGARGSSVMPVEEIGDSAKKLIKGDVLQAGAGIGTLAGAPYMKRGLDIGSAMYQLLGADTEDEFSVAMSRLYGFSENRAMKARNLRKTEDGEYVKKQHREDSEED